MSAPYPFFLPRTRLDLKVQQPSCDREAAGIGMKYTRYGCYGETERAWVLDGTDQLHQPQDSVLALLVT